MLLGTPYNGSIAFLPTPGVLNPCYVTLAQRVNYCAEAGFIGVIIGDPDGAGLTIQ
jgi:hypothetical protein